MNYINDVDELIIPPPFRLGTAQYQFEAHYFQLESIEGRLQALVNRCLNDAFKGSNGNRRRTTHRRNANKKDGASVELQYTVPRNATTTLSFIRYGRVDALNNQDRGAVAYTEVILSCEVIREIRVPGQAAWVRDSDPNVKHEFIGLVYIDDRGFGSAIRDASAVPIVFGRELFGMPKAPGEILYEPEAPHFKQPLLEIWDCETKDEPKFLKLEPAIIFYPKLSAPQKQTQSRPLPLVEQQPGGAVAADFVAQGKPTLARMLVGLKQFADPIANPLQACYQAIVETPLQYYDGALNDRPVRRADGGPVEIKFPERERVDIIAAFGLVESSSRCVTTQRCTFRAGQMIFADPTETTVWELDP